MPENKLQRASAEDRERVFAALVEFIEENGISPTRRELAAATKLSDNTVRKHVDKLIEEGRVLGGRGHRTLRPLI